MKNLHYLFILSFLLISCEEQLPQRYTLTIQKSPEEGGTVFPSTGQHFETSQVAAPEIAVMKSSPVKDNKADSKKNITKYI